MTKEQMEKLSAYDRCRMCACYFANLEANNIHIETECSHEYPCYKQGYCNCFMLDKVKLRKVV